VSFAAIPKVYIHNLLGHHHNLVQITSDDSLQESDNTQDCHFEKFDTQVSYTEFKFILNFLLLKEPQQMVFFYKSKSITKLHHFISPLRGPPFLA
jgi:hypothetical protein